MWGGGGGEDWPKRTRMRGVVSEGLRSLIRVMTWFILLVLLLFGQYVECRVIRRHGLGFLALHAHLPLVRDVVGQLHSTRGNQQCHPYLINSGVNGQMTKTQMITK